MKQVMSSIRMLIVFTLLTGVVYPLLLTLTSQVVFPNQANGSLVMAEDQVVGSSLIGQANDDPRYFWPRPSAISYNPLPSSGSNLGPTSAALRDLVTEREAAFREANQVPVDVVVPQDMLFASGSGLDPHISPEAARLQIDRVTEVRGLDRTAVAELVEQSVESPQLGVLGQPRVNVFLLNIALDKLQ
jgi:potassium-transporting ATPase KdpC subunit